MNVLLATGIYPPDAGGPATYTRAFARALVQLGHEAQVVAYGEKDGIDHIDDFFVERIGRRRNVLMRYWKFADAVRRRARIADVVYLQGPVSEGLPGTIGAVFAGKPVVMKVVGDYAWEMAGVRPFGSAQGRLSASGPSARSARSGRAVMEEMLDKFLAHRHGGGIRVLEWIERWTAKRAKRVIVPSRYLASVVKAWGVPENRIRVVYNAAEPLPAGRSREGARRAFGVESKRVMLTAVRCVPWKNIDFIIDLIVELPEDVLFVVAGDGPSLEGWKKIAIDRGDPSGRPYTDRVRFVGRLERAALADWYRAADLFVLPSGYEGFPHVVSEAASVGLPSLVSDKGGNPETRELFGDNLVRMLPYLDREAWMSALVGPWPERIASAMPEALRFEAMVANTVEVLKEGV